MLHKLSFDDWIDVVAFFATEKNPKYFSLWSYLEYMFMMQTLGWNDTAAKQFVEWGLPNGFNIKEFHHEAATPAEFYADVWYCSDRFSLDRIVRCHAKYVYYISADSKQRCPFLDPDSSLFFTFDESNYTALYNEFYNEWLIWSRRQKDVTNKAYKKSQRDANTAYRRKVKKADDQPKK